MNANYQSYLVDPPDGTFKWRHWLFTLDHKRIGLMYFVVIIFWFLLAALLGLLLRLNLMSPAHYLMGPKVYNATFTLHGVIMVFLFIIPAVPAIFGNFILPIQIGAADVFFPRLNLLSFYLYIAGSVLAIASLFAAGPPDTGWTFYVPFSVQTQTNVSLTTFAAFVLGFSSILTGINFITTVHRLRAPGMGWQQIPLFTWSLYATAWVQVLATPVLAITLVLIMLERAFGIGLFDPQRGGDPLLYQHLFWLYSHPAVYIMILPGMGIISEIIPIAARKSIFGYHAIVASSLAIAISGSLVWAHHMFTSGISDVAVFVFSLLTFVVAVPSAVKVFNWVATLYKGSIVMSPPLLLALSFIYLFTIGGLMGLILGSAATDLHVHDTHFVVAHFHFVMFGGAGMAFFAGIHHWFPKMFGKMYNFKKAYRATLIFVIGFMLHYVPMATVGLMGMPRRYYTYTENFHRLNFVAGFGGILMIAGIIHMAANLLRALRTGEPATANPWGGTTLEWQIPSPPPTENFQGPIVVPAYPYTFVNTIQPGDDYAKS